MIDHKQADQNGSSRYQKCSDLLSKQDPDCNAEHKDSAKTRCTEVWLVAWVNNTDVDDAEGSRDIWAFLGDELGVGVVAREPAIEKMEPPDAGEAAPPPPPVVTVNTMEGKSREFPIEGFKRSDVNDWLGEKHIKVFKHGEDEPALTFVAGDVLFALPFIPELDLTDELIEACLTRNAKDVATLLSNNADPTNGEVMLTALRDPNGTRSNPEIMRLLIQHGCDVNQPLYYDNGTCIAANCLWGLIDVKDDDDTELIQAAQVLIDAGVDVHQKGTSSCSPIVVTTPLHYLRLNYIRYNWEMDMICLLKNAGAMWDDPLLVRVHYDRDQVQGVPHHLRGNTYFSEWFTVEECHTSAIAEWRYI